MRGNVFQTSIDHLNIEPHPHLVVLISGKQCFVVPAYTPGRYKITQKIESLKKQGHREDQLCVHMDNARYMVNCAPSFRPHEAIWFTWESYMAPKKTFDALWPVGEMNAEGLDIIARGILRVQETRPDILVEKHVEQVKDWLIPDPF